MSKTAKKWLIAATFLVVAGMILFVAVMMIYHWDFSRLSTSKTETNTYEIKEEFSNIKFNTKEADILFVASDGACKVVCREQKNVNNSVNVQDDTLTVNETDNRKWYEYIGINTQSTEITVYLPKTDYESLVIKASTGDIEIPGKIKFKSADISLSTGDVNFSSPVSKSAKIHTTTGDIRVENASAGDLDLSATTGDITVSGMTCGGDVKTKVTTGSVRAVNVTCKNLVSSGDTGNINLKNVIAKEKFSVERSTGNVEFENSDAAGIYVKTDTGNVKGTLLSQKVFITETSTGNVDTPKTVTGGKCEIITTTGDIKVKISAGVDK